MNFFYCIPCIRCIHIIIFLTFLENRATNNINRANICRKCQNIGLIYGFIFVGQFSNCQSFLDCGKWAHYRVFSLSINDGNKENRALVEDAPYSSRITHYLYFCYFLYFVL